LGTLTAGVNAIVESIVFAAPPQTIHLPLMRQNT
jgi:hypothetical protein